MEILSEILLVSLLFVFLMPKKQEEMQVLCMRVKKSRQMLQLLLIVSLVLFAMPALAADTATSSQSGIFSDLTSKGIQIFTGMRDIIYVVAGFGIIGVAVGGFFGNINWKWLGAIVIGLMVIGLTGEILVYVGGADAPNIQDTLK